jgi:hypothetical protein
MPHHVPPEDLKCAWNRWNPLELVRGQALRDNGAPFEAWKALEKDLEDNGLYYVSTFCIVRSDKICKYQRISKVLKSPESGYSCM